MAVELSSDERAKVESNRLTDRPSYYNAASASQVQISEDFEAFLILQDPVTLSSTLTVLTTAGLLGTLRLDRDAVAFEALLVDQQDRSDQQSEVATQTSVVNAWRDLFLAGKFSDTPEVGLLIRDVIAQTDETFADEDRLNHLEAVQARVQDRLSQGISSTQLQELLSWPTPLLTY
jgi:hypothetical protein